MVLASIKVQFVSLSLLLFHCGILSGQKVTVTGNITDSLNVPLSFANIIADPSEYGSSITFAISDDNGRYTLSIEKGKRYQLTFSYLGFETETLIIKASQDTVKNMVLSLGSNYLEEVTVTYKLPITIKEDTIIYRTDSFATGKERKLRDILKKLPAVEVDDTGNVFVQGKKITKVLVENKEFFTGDSKLAVNNIPADAVDKIEILDQYNEIGFLKGLEDSNDVVMNIKLKQNKKKFVFGDIDAGLGHKERYTLNPSMYYYSPKTTVNTIIDINNLGSKSFTVTDYIEFEGGSNQLINDSKSYFSLLNDDFAQFLSNKDFSSSRNHFGAINLTKNINQKVELSSYAILSNIKNETKIEAQNEYILNDNQVELRSTTGKHNNQFGVGKLKLKLKPNINTDITFDSYIKASRSSVQNIMYTSSKESSNTINTNINSQNISLKQDIQLHKKLSKNHTISTIINYNYLNPKNSLEKDKIGCKMLIFNQLTI